MKFNWGTFLGGLMDKLPVQGREERWKNELDNLKKEFDKLLEANAPGKDKQDRFIWVRGRIDYLNQLLKNRS